MDSKKREKLFGTLTDSIPALEERAQEIRDEIKKAGTRMYYTPVIFAFMASAGGAIVFTELLPGLWATSAAVLWGVLCGHLALKVVQALRGGDMSSIALEGATDLSLMAWEESKRNPGGAFGRARASMPGSGSGDPRTLRKESPGSSDGW